MGSDHAHNLARGVRGARLAAIADADPFHAPLALACLEAGLPVLCEKPLAPKAAEAVEVVRAHDALRATVLAESVVRSMEQDGARVAVPAVDDVLAGRA